ncbi:MAG: hypothetical protein PHU25_20995 [Deltaproteobacteria bacterium]|nr:hypothetical protein [Deltaproteobacteria bacterium]
MNGSPKTIARWLARLDALWLLVPLGVYAFLAFAGDFHPDADSYYHMGCARLYAAHGWISSFPWMKYTVLADSFPNVHFLQHVALVPLALLFDPVTALKLAVVILPFALVASVYLVLRRWSVALPGLWVGLVALASPVQLTIAVSIKGGALFAILLVWLFDALRARAGRRAFVLSWLTVYAYVGAPLLLAILLAHVAVRRLWDREWDLKPCLWVVGGLAAGLVVNPFWPGHWSQIGAELYNAVVTPSQLAPGDFRGTEWMSLTGRDLLRLTGFPIAAWTLLLVRQLARKERVESRDAFGAILALAFLAAAVLSAKFLFQFFIATLVFLPAVAFAMRPWPRWCAPAAVALGLLVGGLSIHVAHRDLYEHEGGDAARLSRAPGPDDYRALGKWLPGRTKAGEVVLAPWDDFPGLFFFDTYNNYVVGMNTDFLLRRDEKAFNAYYYLYHGRVRDPENLLPAFFGAARLIVVRTRPRNAGEQQLTGRLAGNKRFRELASPSAIFRVFELVP